MGQQKPKMNREVLDEEVKSDFINTACCGDVDVKGSKEPIDASCIEKEESGNAKEVDYEQNEICVSSGDCVGEGVLTQVRKFIIFFRCGAVHVGSASEADVF